MKISSPILSSLLFYFCFIFNIQVVSNQALGADDNKSQLKPQMFTFVNEYYAQAIKINNDHRVVPYDENGVRNTPEFNFQKGNLVKGYLVNDEEYIFIPLHHDNKKLDEGFLVKNPYFNSVIKPVAENFLITQKEFLDKEDATVYFDSHAEVYGKLSDEPSYRSEQNAQKNLQAVYVNSKDKLVVTDTDFSYMPDPDTGEPVLTLKYKTEGRTAVECCEYLRATHDFSKIPYGCKKEAWITSDKTLEYPRDPSLDAVLFNRDTIRKKSCDGKGNGIQKQIIESIPESPMTTPIVQKVTYIAKSGTYCSSIAFKFYQDVSAARAKVLEENPKAPLPEINKLNMVAQASLFDKYSEKYTGGTVTNAYDLFIPSEEQFGARQIGNKKSVVRALQRTLMGELRNCSGRSDFNELAKALMRTVFNRSFAMKFENKKIDNFIQDKKDIAEENLVELLKDIVKSDLQYSCWNKNDPNLIEVLCPEDNPKQAQLMKTKQQETFATKPEKEPPKSPNKNKTKQSAKEIAKTDQNIKKSKSDTDEEAWGKIKSVIADIFNNPDQFIKDTNEINQGFYTGNNVVPEYSKVKYVKNPKTGIAEVDPLSGMDKATKFNVAGKEINGGSCLTLWTDKKLSPIISANSADLSSNLRSHLLQLNQK